MLIIKLNVACEKITKKLIQINVSKEHDLFFNKDNY